MAMFSCFGPPTRPRSLRLLLLLLLGVLCLGHVVQGSRILLMPLPDISQCRQVVSMGRELRTRGHQVILFVPDYFRVRRCTEPVPPGIEDIEVRTFDTSEEIAEVVDNKLEKLGNEVMRGGTGLLGGSREVRDAMRDACSSYMEAKDDLDKVRRAGKVDLVLVDGSPAAHCLTLLPAYLGSPFIAFGSYIQPYDSSTPLPASHYPAPLSALTGNMGFFQRLSNFLSYASQAWSGDMWGGFHQGNALGNRVGQLDRDQLIRKAALYLENSDFIADYPKATFPNLVQVGGLTAAPAGPLPGPLSKFFDGAADTGVVVVSLGPQVFSPNKNLEEKLLSAFRKLDSRVLLRLNASRSVSRVKNVQTVSWFPQNDALGHPNTKVFVSHCGPNSFFEALYHGVPLLCCHFAGSDVLGTGARVAEYGVGLSLDLLAATPENLMSAITNLLTDKSIARRVKSASKLFRSRSETPVQRAVSAIEHVLKYGGGYLRPRVVDMSFFQYAGLDIALALFAVIFAVVGLVAFVVSTQFLPQVAPRTQAGDTSVSMANQETPAAKLASEENRTHSPIIMYALIVLVILFYIYL